MNISSLACSLASERYTLSKVFTRNDQEVPTDEKNLHEVVPRILADFKIIIVEEELKKSQLLLQDPTVTSDNAKLMEAMQHIKHLQEIRNQIAHMVGDRIVIPE